MIKSRGASTYRAQAGMSNCVVSSHMYICKVFLGTDARSTTCDSVQVEHYWDTNTTETVTNANEEHHHHHC